MKRGKTYMLKKTYGCINIIYPGGRILTNKKRNLKEMRDLQNDKI